MRRAGPSILAGLIILVFADGWSAVELHRRSHERAAVKAAYSDVNGIDHGLLSVDAWIGHLRRMAAHEIDRFSLNREQRRIVKVEIERALEELLDQIEALQPSSFKGKVAKLAVGMLSLRRQVPALADGVVAELAQPQSRRKLKQLAMEKLDQYAAQSHDTSRDRARIAVYFARYHVDNRVTLARAAALQRRVRLCSSVLVASLLVVLAVWIVVHRRPALGSLQKPVFAVSVLLGLVALLAALTSPMIEIDARIQRVDFVLLGQTLRFDNQVLFYQSKSIFQVVRVLFETHRLDSMFVGVLILVFSILVPIGKLISTEILLFAGSRLARNRLLRFLAFKAGKWSMADVLVVAIFMAYVGFRSILDSELGHLNVSSPSLSTITTNQTSLEPAFAVFVAFVLFGLVLSELLARSLRSKPTGVPPATA